MEEWVCAVKIAGSKKSKYKIRKTIKEECLFSKEKKYGAYQINGSKVWQVLIANDPDCTAIIKEKNINGHIGLESIIEEIKYRSFWSDNKRAYAKKRR